MAFERYNKYEVLKLDDIYKYLSLIQMTTLVEAIKTIQNGREADGKPRCNSYVVVNQEMPYAEAVWQLIQEHWEKTN